MSVTAETVTNALKSVIDPVTGKDIVTTNMMRALTVKGGDVHFVLEVDPARAKQLEPVRLEAEARVKALAGVTSVSVVMTAHSAPTAPPDLKPAGRPKPSAPAKIPGVDRIIAIASGKGGVGKSTVSANLACTLAAEGRRVGLLDADVFGPSQPRMMGVSGRPGSADGKRILPMHNHGVTMMSMGLMVGEGQAVVWRGPMLMSALQQMLMQVEWGALDVLIVDLPPGTGDVQLTLAQKAQLDGAIIVSTPQDVALLDARKGIEMFDKVKIPIIGMIENMSTHICSNCGHEEHLFGHGGVAKEAAKLDVPLLAEIPLHLDIRVASDSGEPIVVAKPDSASAGAFRQIAKTLIDGGLA
ncbi:MAG: Mrp/NBP35 family ATP-binding protein [Marinosulfonomonas sp.]|nr:Mrp/NBP35 family ATP-binding protein [Marinosulfonomonas sp.]